MREVLPSEHGGHSKFQHILVRSEVHGQIGFSVLETRCKLLLCYYLLIVSCRLPVACY
jgi:hypothetical protein